MTSRGRVAVAHSPEETAAGATRPGPGGSRAPGGPPARRSRLTGRAVVLGLVLVVLAFSYASSLRAYVDQRDQIQSLKADIEATEANIAELEREKRRWEDEAYVRAQARAALGYLMPGETGYQVLDENGEPLGARADLHDPDEVVKEQPTPWWEDVWASVELAGHPPKNRGEAPDRIDGVKQNKQEQQ